ncbi:MAG: YxeA family protein [Corynebacterium sp.]|nr:YxeA family protein [Corynebacterium sp.]
MNSQNGSSATIKSVLIAFIVIIGALLAVLLVTRNSNATIDRFNPLVTQEVAYVRVAPKATEVENASAVDSSGEELAYTLTFTAWGLDDEIVAVDHRGQFVANISYPTNEEVPAPALKALGME